ncbi:diaminopimelate decarboxylase [Neomicrococcus lactis]|uniref:diaminopimelate decarboxylase n=1 Tax=Neomicrococcus lactis TaxID=732241 RepID=UPI0023012A13|nr:diaminopimelate decarboxylase [Neomicrococcus lactis]
MPASPLAPAWLSFPEDVNALRPLEWAAGVSRSENDDALSIQGISVTDLAVEFGTPLYVMDADDFRARARSFKNAFDAAFQDICGGVDVYYAGKAFLSFDVARWVKDEGLRLDTCSGGELALALRAGLDPENIGLHGNNKSKAEITKAIEVGLGRIVVDSLDELERVSQIAEQLGKQANVMLRLTPGVHAHTHEFIATAHEDQKFGLSMVEGDPLLDGAGEVEGKSPAAVAVSRGLKDPNINLLGLHSHIGSQIFDTDGFALAAERMVTFLGAMSQDHGVVLKELDLGGGFGIAYTEQDEPRTPEELATQMAEIVKSTCAKVGIESPRISIEPGRSIAGPSTFTLYEIGVRKTVIVDSELGDSPRHYVSVDGGMSDNARPVLYDADYSAVLASRTSQADAIISRVVGKHCESGDIVVKDAYLPADLTAGDLLAVPATGAYCWALASNYNYLGRPAVVAVSGGEAQLMIRRETEDDLFDRDLGAK